MASYGIKATNHHKTDKRQFLSFCVSMEHSHKKCSFIVQILIKKCMQLHIKHLRKSLHLNISDKALT